MKKHLLKLSIYFKKIKKKDFAIILFCLCIALIFWLLNALSNSYSENIKLAVKYTHFPSNKILLHKAPSILSLNIRALGRHILWYKIISKFTSLKVNVESNLVYTKDKGFICTNLLIGRISGHLSSNIHVLNVQPDSIFFLFDEKTEKQLPINLDMDLSFDNQYGISSPISITPDSVTVYGPMSLLDTLNTWNTKKIAFKNISKRIDMEVELVKPFDENIVISSKTAQIKIPVEAFTEAKIEVAIIIKNGPKDLNIRIHPPKTKIVFQVPLSKFNFIEANMFYAIIDFSDINLQSDHYIKVTLSKYPLYIKHIRLIPDEVEYIIQK